MIARMAVCVQTKTDNWFILNVANEMAICLLFDFNDDGTSLNDLRIHQLADPGLNGKRIN